MRVRFSNLLLVAVLLGLASCSGKDINDNDPEALYHEAESDIQNDRYQLAVDKLRILKSKFPYSKYSIEAKLKLADVYFMQENFSEAALSYEAFKDLHPKHEKVPYALFRMAKSYYNDMPGNIARDLGPAFKAQTSYEGFLAKYPSAPEAEEARKDLADTRQKIAEKELYVGTFYYKRDFYESARGRFNKIIHTYPETQAANDARKYLAKIEKEIGPEQ